MIVWPVTLKENKYSKWYSELIANAQNRVLPSGTYTEKHHIIPKSWLGPDTEENIVKLTAREHYIAHALLWKFNVPKKHHIQMMHAFDSMTKMKYGRRHYKINSRIFESLKLEHIAHMKTKTGNKNPNFGKPMLPHVKERLKEANLQKYKQRQAGMFVGPIKPSNTFTFRGIIYRGISEASRQTGIPPGKMKLQIKYWGLNPDIETIRQIDSGELQYPRVAPNKGVAMSEEQRQAIKETKRIKFQKLKEAGLPNPNTGRKASDETRKRISEKAIGRKASDETRRILSQASKGKSKSPEHIAAIRLAKAAKKNNKLQQ
jgi:hypothetical protein